MEFNDFLSLKGILKQRSVPRTPEQIGVAERMNRTIQETAISMLHATKYQMILGRSSCNSSHFEES